MSNLTEKDLKTLKEGTEAELRDYKLPYIDSKKDLDIVIKTLNKRQHDYGTTVYAISITTLAMHYYQCSIHGATGFQSSCADLDFIGRNRNYEDGFAIIDYNKLLYPQYEEDVPGFWDYIFKNSEIISEKAQKLIDKHKREKIHVHPEVWNHWKKLSEVQQALHPKISQGSM